MVTIHWNYAALQRALETPEMTAAAERLGAELADRVRAQHILVEGIPGDMELPVDVFTVGESTAVIVTHPSGLAAQAKDGVLTRAAADLGLEVNG